MSHGLTERGTHPDNGVRPRFGRERRADTDEPRTRLTKRRRPDTRARGACGSTNVQIQRQRAGGPLSRAAGVPVSRAGLSFPSDENVLKLTAAMVVQRCDDTGNAEL